MASKKIRRLLWGKNSKYTWWGKIGYHSMYKGGYENYIYGIKGVIAFQVYHGWGNRYEENFKNL